MQVKYQVERKYTSISWLVSAAPQQHILLIPTSRLWLRVLAVCRRKRHDQPQLSPLSSIAAKGFALFCFQHKGKEVTLDALGLLHLLQIYTGGYKTCSLKQTDASPTRWAEEGVWWYSLRHVKHKDMVYYVLVRIYLETFLTHIVLKSLKHQWRFLTRLSYN